MNNKSNILIVAPHCDDEVLGCGGTIAKYVKEKHNVYVLILTNANMGDKNIFTKKDIERVRKESLLAHKILGVKKTIFLDFPAPSLHTFPNHKIADNIRQMILKFKIETLFLPFPGDMHLDHYYSYIAGIVASRASKNTNVKNIFCYEVMSETECSPHNLNNQFNPNYYIIIDDYIDTKIKALRCFKSQIYPSPHPRSINSVKNLALYRGTSINSKFAEAFKLERIIIT